MSSPVPLSDFVTFRLRKCIIKVLESRRYGILSDILSSSVLNKQVLPVLWRFFAIEKGVLTCEMFPDVLSFEVACRVGIVDEKFISNMNNRLYQKQSLETDEPNGIDIPPVVSDHFDANPSIWWEKYIEVCLEREDGLDYPDHRLCASVKVPNLNPTYGPETISANLRAPIFGFTNRKSQLYTIIGIKTFEEAYDLALGVLARHPHLVREIYPSLFCEIQNTLVFTKFGHEILNLYHSNRKFDLRWCPNGTMKVVESNTTLGNLLGIARLEYGCDYNILTWIRDESYLDCSDSEKESYVDSDVFDDIGLFELPRK